MRGKKAEKREDVWGAQAKRYRAGHEWDLEGRSGRGGPRLMSTLIQESLGSDTAGESERNANDGGCQGANSVGTR